jgi:hypothetical protein
MGRACSTNGEEEEEEEEEEEKKNAYMRLVGKPEGKRPRRRWVNNIKMDLREIGWSGMDWIWLTTGTSGRLL